MGPLACFGVLSSWLLPQCLGLCGDSNNPKHRLIRPLVYQMTKEVVVPLLKQPYADDIAKKMDGFVGSPHIDT